MGYDLQDNWKNPLSMGDEKVQKTQLLTSGSFSSEKGFKGKGGAGQVKAGRKEDHTSKGIQTCAEADKPLGMAREVGKVKEN